MLSDYCITLSNNCMEVDYCPLNMTIWLYLTGLTEQVDMTVMLAIMMFQSQFNMFLLGYFIQYISLVIVHAFYI